MAELQIKEFKQPETIQFNYEELKAELAEKVQTYELMVYTEDTMKEAKADRASLNRLKKALNDERIKREKEYLEPFNDFKNKINEIIKIIDKPVGIIDQQIKEFEEAKKAEKADEIKRWYTDEREALTAPEWLTIEQIFNPRWLNASTTMKTVQSEIQDAVNKINADRQTIHELPEFAFEALEVYKTTLDISKAISEGKRLAEIQKRKQEAEAQKAAVAENATTTEVKQPELLQETKQPEAEQPKTYWVAFRALLTVPQAKELKAFFENNNIQFEAVRE